MGRNIMEPTRSEVLAVVHEFQQIGPRSFQSLYGYRDSTKYDLYFRQHRYPPKAIYNVARKRARGESDKSGEARGLGGGKPVNYRLERLRFKIVLKDQLEFPEGLDIPDAAVDDTAQRPIALRRGQARYRSMLMHVYDSACAVTRCRVSEILEAAHIKPYSDLRDYAPSNGILLRADIHTLFDLQLIRINPDTMAVAVDRSIRDPIYRNLHGTKVFQPKKKSSRPDQKYLKQRWDQDRRNVRGT
jgi:hypothetical protein